MGQRTGFSGRAKAAVFAAALVALAAACGGGVAAPPSATPLPYAIQPDVDRVFLNDTVRFSLVDSQTGESMDGARWRITSPHNVPGDRGVMRSDGLYTAPRVVPSPKIVSIAARFGVDYAAEFYVLDPRYPDPEATTFPGQGMSDIDFKRVEPRAVIERGVRAGETVAITAADGTGRPLVIDHCEIVRDNRVVEDAGTITPDCVYTAPAVVPDPPEVGITIIYYREGSTPGQLSAIGTPHFAILPSE